MPLRKETHAIVKVDDLRAVPQNPYEADRPAVERRAVTTATRIISALLLIGFFGAAALVKAASDAINKG